MSFSFPKESTKDSGYNPEQVDSFVELARRQFNDASLGLLTADQVRNTEFDLVSSGYVIGAVDTALDRLEDSFSAREIAHQKITRGDEALADRLARLIEIVKGRTERPKRLKFKSTGWLLRGYNRKQVDNLCDQIALHLGSGTKLPLNVVRRSTFKVKRGGYVESQVDAFIDRVVEVLQIEANR